MFLATVMVGVELVPGKVLAVGMNDHIAKPIKPDIMYSTMVKWITPGTDPDI